MSQCSFTHTMVCHGYNKKLKVDEIHEDEPAEKIVVRISGPEAAYVSTPICLVQAAYVVLNESDKLPVRGGVYTPGAAFSSTSLLQRLMSHGMKFDVLSDAS